MIRSHDYGGSRNCSQHFLQPRAVLLRHLRKSDPHTQVGIRDANGALNLDAKVLRGNFYQQHGAHGISCSRLHVAAMQADVRTPGPDANVAALLANLDAALAFVAWTSAFFRGRENCTVRTGGRIGSWRRTVSDSCRSRRSRSVCTCSPPQCCQVSAAVRFLRHNSLALEMV